MLFFSPPPFFLLALSFPPLLFLPWCDFGANISCISSGTTRSTEPAFGRLFTQMAGKLVTFLKKRLLFIASNSEKRYWDWTLPRIRAQIELSSTLVYDYKISTSGSCAKNSHSARGDERQWCNSEIFVTPSFNEWVVFSWLLCFALQYMFIQIGPQTPVLSFVPPGWGANSLQSCRSYSFSGHFLVILKQKVLDSSISELQCKVAYNPNTFSLNWKQRTAEKAVDDALQYIKMYVEGV